ncbi:MAG TPA: cbb3-type cytochrome c oxidase subunit I [Acidimicrobiales bacterium]|nr:cbb3-type cytochrome c oxidase subunit I [Acidimicrobiales bacterium]
MNLLNTADHKQIGSLQIVASLLALAIGGAAAIAVRAMASSGTIGHVDAVVSLDHAMVGVFVVLPLWFGIATVVTPLQIGTNRLSFPKLSAAALWTHVGGAVLVIAGYTHTPANPLGRTVFAPVPLPGSLAKLADTKGPDLMVLGMILGAVATVLMAVSLVTTIASRRTHGLTMERLPYFSWSVLVGGIGVALATPVFIAALSLVWIDQHFGGKFFTSSAANVFWTHGIWLGGRPEALLASVFVLGAGSDIIGTATGRANELDKVTRAALAAFATFSFATWTLTASQAGGVMAPFSNVVTALPVLAAGVVVLSWLGQLRHGVKLVPAVLPLVLTLALGAVAVIDFVARLTTDNRGATWSEASLVLFAVAIPVAGAVAALVHWAPKFVGGTVPAGIATLASLATAGGFALFTMSGVLLGSKAAPYFAHTWDKSDSRGALALAGAAGVAIAALGVVILALGYVTARSKSGRANPYGTGVTLEWAAASPPPPDNFESVPDVTSATPLASTGARS